MGFIKDIANANGIYMESDIKELRERCHALWAALVSLRCAADVRTEAIEQSMKIIEPEIKDPEKMMELRNIRSCCRELNSDVAIADYVIEAYSRWDNH